METKNQDAKQKSLTSTTQTGSVTVDGNVTGSVIVTGDFNTVTAQIRMSQVHHGEEF